MDAVSPAPPELREVELVAALGVEFCGLDREEDAASPSTISIFSFSGSSLSGSPRITRSLLGSFSVTSGPEICWYIASESVRVDSRSILNARSFTCCNAYRNKQSKTKRTTSYLTTIN